MACEDVDGVDDGLGRTALNAARLGGEAIASYTSAFHDARQSEGVRRAAAIAAEVLSAEVIYHYLRHVRPSDTLLIDRGRDHIGTTEIDWIVNPLDGPANLLTRTRHVAVSVTVAVEKQLVAGAICRPAESDWYYADDGDHGSSHGRYDVSATNGHAIGAIGLNMQSRRLPKDVRILESVTRMAKTVNGCGSAACEYIRVLKGETDAYVSLGGEPWNELCGVPLVCRGGGSVTRLTLGDKRQIFLSGVSNVVGKLVDGLASDVRIVDVSKFGGS